MAYEAGTAYLTVLPSFKGGARSIADQLNGPMGRAGQQGGAAYGSGITQGQGKSGFAAAGAKAGGFFLAAFAAIGLAEIGRTVTTYLSDAIGAASDLAETQSKSNTIFGESSEVVNKWAQDAATAAGLSKAAALDAASGFGNMFTQLGFASDEAANMSTGVVQLAADLGSFNNLPTEDVANRISAAFRGEYDSLQALIPNINAARVQQEALTATGKKAASELTAQEKATAVLSLVQRDGAAAVGDYAKTADGLANSQKTLNAELENVKTEIGEALLPAATTLFRFFADEGVPIAQELAAWFTANKEEITAFALQATDAGLAFVGAVLTMLRTWMQFQDGFLTVADNVLKFWWTVADGILGAAEMAFGWVPGVGDKIRDTRTRMGELRATSDQQFGAMRAAADRMTQGVRAGETAVGDLRSKVRGLDGFTANVRVRVNVDEYLSQIPGTGQYIAAQGRASGGPIVAGRPYMVGERGPELIVPKASGTVLTAGQTSAAMSGPMELGSKTIRALGAETGRVVLAGSGMVVSDRARATRLAGRP